MGFPIERLVRRGIKNMKLDRYLIVGKKHQKPSARLTVSSPALDSHEVAVKISLDIPDELFSRPQLQASIKVPNDSVSALVIEADVIDNIQEIVSKELGVDLNIALVESA